MLLPDEILNAFLEQHANNDTHRLLLSAARYPGIDMEFAVRQIEGRRKAAEKFPSLTGNANFIYPIKLSMEQCSSETTALYKAALTDGLSVIDLTGGLGIDAIFMSKQSRSYCYVERNEELAEVATHNFAACKVTVESHCADGLDFLRSNNRQFDCIYLDPARRDDKKQKVVLLSACEPDVPANLGLLWQHTNKILVKASPMLDITQAARELGYVERVHVVAVKNECKELLFECRKNASEYSIVSINLQSDNNVPFCFTPQEETDAQTTYTNQLGSYLYEPNAAILKAGAFRLTGMRFGLQKLHPDSHLYTSDTLRNDFPGKTFRIEAAGSLNKQTVKKLLPGRKANVVVRNFPARPEEIRKKFGLLDGGEKFLFATTLYDGQKTGIICQRV
jgi:16S rRNA G966 N2-methylase RsmD